MRRPWGDPLLGRDPICFEQGRKLTVHAQVANPSLIKCLEIAGIFKCREGLLCCWVNVFQHDLELRVRFECS